MEFKFGSGSIPESTSQSSSKMKSVVAATSSPSQYSIAKDRPRRDIKPPQRYAEADWLLMP